MLTKQRVVFICLCCLFLLVGCSSSENTESSDVKWDLSLAVNGTDTQIDTLVANHFADLVAEKSNGSIVINVFPNDTLAGGNSTKGVEYIATGGSDLGIYATSVLANIEPKVSVSTLPWTFESYEDASKTIDQTGGQYYKKVLAPKGITYLGSFHNGFRQLSNSKHPVTTVADLQGLKLRVPGSAVYMDFFNALGANPTAMSWSEVFTAIQQGTIDGQENGVSITKSAKMDEVQPYITIWNYSYETDLFIANTEIWDSLDEETQSIIEECVKESCAWGRQKVEQDEETIIQEFKDEGIQVDVLTEEQLQPFKEQIQGVLDKHKAIYGEEAIKAFGIN